MANYAATNFRRINVDSFVEDKFLDEKQSEFKFDFSNIRNLMHGGQTVEGLRLLINEAPFQQKMHIMDKLEYLKLLAEALGAIKERDAVLSTLTAAQADALISLLFRGMDLCAEYSQSVWLVWHEAVVSKFGMGVLMRALTNRKQLL